uniref:Globin domain-containing protein n=1 Tax=Hemiselmis andersenii TaxID=464988 RepID=A0A7S1E185_HEMAN|mmetsp:Transcript_33308/g.81128  ORF Transcript_33308/g.81128 Transcript_33308/m.81128 type:complete len:1642 (+) Transcript_33308:208-5133(+)
MSGSASPDRGDDGKVFRSALAALHSDKHDNVSTAAAEGDHNDDMSSSEASGFFESESQHDGTPKSSSRDHSEKSESVARVHSDTHSGYAPGSSVDGGGSAHGNHTPNSSVFNPAASFDILPPHPEIANVPVPDAVVISNSPASHNPVVPRLPSINITDPPVEHTTHLSLMVKANVTPTGSPIQGVAAAKLSSSSNFSSSTPTQPPGAVPPRTASPVPGSPHNDPTPKISSQDTQPQLHPASGGSHAPGPALPAGHPPPVEGQEYTCPFMMIQALMDAQDAAEGASPAPGVAAISAEPPKVPSNAFSTRASTSSTRKEDKDKDKKEKKKDRKERRDKGGLELRRKHSSGKHKHSSSPQKLTEEEEARNALAQLACPMTGFRTKRTTDGRLSESSGGSSLSGSVAGGSAVSGSRRSARSATSSKHSKGHSSHPSHSKGSHMNSRHTSKHLEHIAPSARTGGNLSGQSSQNTGRVSINHRVRRVQRLGQFSIYEASRYEPLLRKSWEQLQEINNRQELGLKFYEMFFKDNPALHSMFTRSVTVMGEKFADILADIVTAVEDVTAMKNKLKALAPMHLKVGVKIEHSVRMGKALFATFEEILGEGWTSEIRAAWEWLWSWLSQLLHQSLEDARNEATVVTYSWDLAMDRNSEEEMGELLFDTLFELAPNLKPVYTKPRQILSCKFVEMMLTLVSFHGDSLVMEEQINLLGFRHIKYGAKKQHVRVMGDVLIETMARAVGEDWTMDMAEAWNELWLHSCGLMMNVIDDASTHGARVQELWQRVRIKSTEMKFGSTLRKLLLSGTEWVSSLSHGILETTSPMGKSQVQAGVGHLDSELLPMAAAVDASKVKGKKKKQSEAEQEGFQSLFRDDDPAQGGNSTESDAIGRHFWVMLTELLELLWEPEKQHERLIVTTTMLFQWGIRTHHLATIGDALFQTMSKFLGSIITPEDCDAWAWWWKITSKGIAKTLAVCEQNHAQKIRSTWELCKTLKKPEELGELWFKELARIAPHVTVLFRRPKKIQASQFMSIVDMLVSFIETPTIFFEGFKTLTIRHIKYGVKGEYAKAFGKSVLNAIDKTLEEKYDEEVAQAWQMLWVRASSCVSRALNVGTNPIIVSLVQGDLDKLCNAMDCASRGERFEWLTTVDVNGEILSPLYWSLRDGNFATAGFIINDLLMIRADRESYYYGREVLFSKHPDVVDHLCRDSPHLLFQLFDGLMWHSKDVENGMIRVNYYIRELIGEPNKEANVWKQALCTLTDAEDPLYFAHPVVRKILEVKWTQFGLKCFLVMQSFYLFLLTLFMIGNIEFQHDCRFEGIRFFLGGVSLLCALAQTYVAFKHWSMGWTTTLQVKFTPLKVQLPRYLSEPWNMCRFVATWLLSIVSFVETCHSAFPAPEDAYLTLSGVPYSSFQYAGMSMNAFVGVLLWIQLLQALALSENLSSVTFKLGALFEDVLRNLVLVAFLTLGFAAALTCLDEEHFDTFGESTTVLVRVILNVDPPSLLNISAFGLFFLCLFSIVVIIGMLNILIAMLWSSYGHNRNNMTGFATLRRARICIHMEALLPHSLRCKLFDGMEFDKPVPFNIGDSGPCGGLQVLEPAKIRNRPHYKPDRVLRFTGEANHTDPWPTLAQSYDGEYQAAPQDQTLYNGVE